MIPLIVALAATSPAPVLLAAAGLFMLGLAVTISGLRGGRDND